MVLTINNHINGAKLPTTTTTATHFSLHRSNHRVQPMNPRKPCYIVAATGKFNPRTTKFDSKNRRGGGTTSSSTTTTKEDIKEKNKNYVEDNVNGAVEDFADDGFVIPELPGDKPDWFEGPQWDAFGFFVQYLWAFGVVFAVSTSLFSFLSLIVVICLPLVNMLVINLYFLIPEA